MPAWRRPERNIMRKLSKNTALGYLTLLAVALLTAGRALIFLLPQTDFWQLLNTLSQLTITLSGGIWLFSRIYEELLNKKRADIFRTISVLTGILGFIFCLSGLAADWRALNPWGLAARISFAVFALSWALYTAAQAFGHKAGRLLARLNGLISLLALLTLSSVLAADIFYASAQLPFEALFLYILLLVIDLLGMFAPVIYSLYESISRMALIMAKGSVQRAFPLLFQPSRRNSSQLSICFFNI